MTEGRTRIWVASFVTLVFVCGLSLGFAVTQWLPPRGASAWGPGAGGPPGGPDGPHRSGGRRPSREEIGRRISQRILNRLDEDPTFTSEQRERMEALFAERQERFRALNLEMRERFETERESLRTEIAEILTESQMATFEEMRGLGRRGRRGDGPPPRR